MLFTRSARAAWRRPLLLAGLALLAPGAAHATDGYFLSGAGAKAKGAAGVAIAQPQDALAIATNPAAATEVGHRLDIGVELFAPDRSASISGNGAGLNGQYSGNGQGPFLLPEIGYVRPLSDRVAVGISINGNGGMNTSYRQNPFAAIGATGTAGVDFKQIIISPTIAYRLAPGHSIGVSAVGVLQAFRASGIAPFAGFSADPANFTGNGTDWAAGGGVRVGYLGHLGSRITIGAYYQSRLSTGRFAKYAGLFAEQGGFDTPANYGAGIAVKATNALTLAADVKRIDYGSIRSVGTPLAPLFAGRPFGASDGPGFGWTDITVYKLGATYALNKALTLRAGYGRSGNPVPASQTLLNILAPGVVQDHFTAGATVTLKSGIELTGFAMHAPRNRVQGNGSIPAPFGGGEASIALAETSAGLSVGLKFR